MKRCQTHQENLLVGEKRKVMLSVADADPGPEDPNVFGPSKSVSKRNGSGSGYRTFNHQAKLVRKALIPTVF